MIRPLSLLKSGDCLNIYLDLFLTFARVGVCTFGGGYAMLPILQRDVVEKKGWATEEQLSDYYAIDLMQFLGENGISVPKDVAVAGFAGTQMSELVFPALTTVRQDSSLRAKTAMEKLRDLQENRETSTSVMLPVALIERGSTG